MEYKVVVNSNGDRYWYKKVWYRKGKLHREDGPAVEYANGDKFWYRNNQLHREDGPAIEYANGEKRWYRNNQLHREDGPAVECVNGIKAWYLNGVKMSAKKHRHLTQPEKEMTVEQIAKELGYRIKIIGG